MSTLTLNAGLRRQKPETAPAAPALVPEGARIILGDHLSEDGLPAPLRPARDTMFGPRGVAFMGEGLAVADTGHHRLLFWRRRPSHDNQPADFLIGQPDFEAEGRNAGGVPNASRVNMPTGIACDGRVLALADAWNHRVLIWKRLPEHDNQPADLVLGQADFSGGLANRGGQAGAHTLNWCYGVTIAENRLFVADTGNRRVLVWNGLPDRNGAPADLVLGQSDMCTHDDNGGHGPDATGMRWPHAIVVLGDGRILVADAGNSRVMLWNSMPNADGAPCAFVLGQRDMGQIDHNRAGYDPDERALNMPYGLAAAGDRLLCADTANSRLVSYRLAELAADSPAAGLAGQKGFADKGDNRWRAATRDSLCWPFALAARDDLVAIADTGNNRVLLWERAL